MSTPVASLVQHRTKLQQLESQVTALLVAHAKSSARYAELYSEYVQLKEGMEALRLENARLRNEGSRHANSR